MTTKRLVANLCAIARDKRMERTIGDGLTTKRSILEEAAKRLDNRLEMDDCEWCGYFRIQSIPMPDGWIRAHHYCPMCGKKLR